MAAIDSPDLSNAEPSKPKAEPSKPQPEPSKPKSEQYIHKAEQSNLNFGARQGEKYSDMTIVCGKTEFKVHKVIVCRQAMALDNMMSGGFKEARDGRIATEATNPVTMSLFLDLLYGGLKEVAAKISQEVEKHTPPYPNERLGAALEIIRMYALGEYWQSETVMDWTVAELTARFAATKLWTPDDTASILTCIMEEIPEERSGAVLKTLNGIIAGHCSGFVRSQAFIDAFVKMRADIIKHVFNVALMGNVTVKYW